MKKILILACLLSLQASAMLRSTNPLLRRKAYNSPQELQKIFGYAARVFNADRERTYLFYKNVQFSRSWLQNGDLKLHAFIHNPMGPTQGTNDMVSDIMIFKKSAIK